MRLLDWIKETGRIKRATRHENPELVAFYWDGSCAEGRLLKDVSTSGAYFRTDDRWYPGTILEVTLAHNFGDASNGRAHFTLPCEVVRNGPDGIGVRFMTNGRKKLLERFIQDAVNKTHSNGTKGHALVEFALLLPVTFLLVVLAVNFGAWIYSWIGVANAARAAADYAILSGASAQDPNTATGAQIKSMIQADVSYLPNYSTTNPAIAVCRDDNGTITTLSGTCPSTNSTSGTCSSSQVPQDPESTPSGVTYSDITIYVTYTYSPFISTFSFPNLHVGLPTMPTTISRCTVMRVLQ